MNIVRRLLQKLIDPSGYDITDWSIFTKKNISLRTVDSYSGIVTRGNGRSAGYIAEHLGGIGDSNFVELHRLKGRGELDRGKTKAFFSISQDDMQKAWKIVSELIIKYEIPLAKFVRPNADNLEVIYGNKGDGELRNKPIVVYTHNYKGDSKSQQQLEQNFVKFLNHAEHSLRKAGIEPAGRPMAARQIPGSQFISYRNDFAEHEKDNYISAVDALRHKTPHNPFNQPDFLRNLSLRPALKQEVIQEPQVKQASVRVRVEANLHGQNFVLVFPKSASEKQIGEYCAKLGFKGSVKGAQNAMNSSEMHIWPVNAEDKMLLAYKCRDYKSHITDDMRRPRENIQKKDIKPRAESPAAEHRR